LALFLIFINPIASFLASEEKPIPLFFAIIIKVSPLKSKITLKVDAFECLIVFEKNSCKILKIVILCFLSIFFSSPKTAKLGSKEFKLLNLSTSN
jgi:hypothetical protein